MLQSRLAQFHFSSEIEKAFNQWVLAFTQRLADDTVGATATAEQVRNTLERIDRDQPDNVDVLTTLAQTYGVIGEKDLALKLGQRAIMLLPTAKNATDGPAMEESLALIQTIVGENKSAISTLTHLLHTPYNSRYYTPTGITPALLMLDPFWDPLRGDPAFKELYEEKQP